MTWGIHINPVNEWGYEMRDWKPVIHIEKYRQSSDSATRTYSALAGLNIRIQVINLPVTVDIKKYSTNWSHSYNPSTGVLSLSSSGRGTQIMDRDIYVEFL